MRWSQATETGLVRANNEDALLVLPALRIFAVADGMGGHRAGEVASQLAVRELAAYLQEVIDWHDPLAVLTSAVQRANTRIFEAALHNQAFKGMGTTLSVLMLRERCAYLAHVGDSRIYLLRDGLIQQLTVDHTLVEEMLRHNRVLAGTYDSSCWRHVLTRALGSEPAVMVDTGVVEVRPGDYFLLCTDGLTAHLEAEEILSVVRGCGGNLDRAVSQLIAEALVRGGSDNITVVLVDAV